MTDQTASINEGTTIQTTGGEPNPPVPEVIAQGPVTDPALANQPHPATLQPQTTVEPSPSAALQPVSGSAQVQQPSPGSTAGPAPKAAQPVKTSPQAVASATGAKPVAPATPAVSTPVSQVTDPTHAALMVKGKVSELHTLVHNAAGYASMPIHAIESVIADMNYLFGVIRTKI